MSSFRHQLLSWINRGEPFALATVVRAEGSTPRAVGATLLVSASGERFAGSVSAGCLDNEVIHAATEVLATGRHRLLRFGPDGSPPWQEGLSCGGCVEVRIDPWFGCLQRPAMKALADQARSWLSAGKNAVILSRGENHFGFDGEGQEAGERAAFAPHEIETARAQLSREGRCLLDTTSVEPFFIRTLLRAPRLVLVGAVDTAAHLVAFAQHAGFECIVLDPRRNYAQAERFEVAPGRLIHAWPQELSTLSLNQRDAALVLSHDPKIDDLALLELLKTKVGYLGALGSKRSHVRRLERLKSAGAAEAELARIEGPAGLHLGAADAVGIALGMMAGIVRSQAARGVWQ